MMISKSIGSYITLSTILLFVQVSNYAFGTSPSTTFSPPQTKLKSIPAFGIPAPERLRQLLQSEIDGTREDSKPVLLPCCYDGLTARLIAKAGFEATFMTGFGVSGT